jgi:hypothetical protein
MLLFAKFVRILHFLFLLFMVLTPFFGNEFLLTYHFITAPFLLLHWITNNDTCALTLIESKITGIKEINTFTGSIIKPIYNAHFTNKHFYWITVLLFMITTYRLWYEYHFWYLLLASKIVWISLKGFFNKFVN